MPDSHKPVERRVRTITHPTPYHRWEMLMRVIISVFFMYVFS